MSSQTYTTPSVYPSFVQKIDTVQLIIGSIFMVCVEVEMLKWVDKQLYSKLNLRWYSFA